MHNLEQIMEKNIVLYNERKLNCAETVLITMCEYMDISDRLVPRIATAFGGGLAGSQSVCGAVTGGLMAIGVIAGREAGGDQQPCREMGARFMDEFAAVHGTLACCELTGVDMKDPAQMEAFRAPGGKHHTVCNECVRWVCRYIAKLLEERS